jgi:hypothetical protein
VPVYVRLLLEARNLISFDNRNSFPQIPPVKTEIIGWIKIKEPQNVEI